MPLLNKKLTPMPNLLFRLLPLPTGGLGHLRRLAILEGWGYPVVKEYLTTENGIRYVRGVGQLLNIT